MGVTNVGKSTLINQLLAHYGGEAGITTSNRRYDFGYDSYSLDA